MSTPTFRHEEVVVAFGDLPATLVTLASGEQIVSFAMFEESPVTASVDEFMLALFAGAELLSSGLPVATTYQTLSASIGETTQLVAARGVTVSVKEAPNSSGTWTAGSVRFTVLIEAA